MKKNLLIVAFLILGFANTAFCNENPQVSNAEIKQKACQNVFSFINIDLSLMSPRAQAADISVSDTTKPIDKKGAIEPVSNKQPQTVYKTPEKTTNKTSLFRLDLLHIIKIQLF